MGKPRYSLNDGDLGVRDCVFTALINTFEVSKVFPR